jgi:hypothetical protein
MGSSYCETIMGAFKNGLDRRYAQLVRDCQYQHRHGGYSGTFAEKRNVQVIPPPDGKKVWDREVAQTHCQENNDKWDASYAYWLGNSRWYVGGWCSD